MFLTPGMFGNMRLSTGQTARALLIPAAAVQTDQARKIVYVVGKDGMVAAKPVEIGPEVDGLRVIRAGLAPTDRVVINGYQFRSEEHTSELQSLMRISYAVFCLKKKQKTDKHLAYARAAKGDGVRRRT